MNDALKVVKMLRKMAVSSIIQYIEDNLEKG